MIKRNKTAKYIQKGIILFVITLCIAILASCNAKTEKEPVSSLPVSSVRPTEIPVLSLPQFEKPKVGDEIAIMTVKKFGKIKIMFFKDKAPKAVENFITHSKNKYYNNTTFHRIITGLSVQGGDPLGTGKGGKSIWNKFFEDEYSSDLRNFKGALGMFNDGPNTNGSQFYFVQADNKKLDLGAIESFQNIVKDKYKEIGGTPWLDYKHTVFGQIFEGLDVLDKIANSNIANKTGKVTTKVILEKVEIVTYS